MTAEFNLARCGKYRAHPIETQQFERKLRPFPATAARLLSICRSPDSPIQEVTELIECEPAIGIKLLAMANSPLFGTAREVASVSHAIVLLGYETVSQLALSIAAGPLFSSGDDEYFSYRIQLMRESLGCSTVCRLLAGASNLADPSEAFFGGMMLDIGKLLIMDIAPGIYSEILEQETAADLNAIESAVFGADHAELGSRCGMKWGLPNSVVEAIKLHHQKPDDNFSGFCRVAIAGSYFARKWLVGFCETEHILDNVIEDSFLACALDEIQIKANEIYKEVEMLLLPKERV